MPALFFRNDSPVSVKRWWLCINHQHRHSAIGFVTPAQRHAGLGPALLKKRALVYERERQTNPQRCSKEARQWKHVDVVHLNPEILQIEEPQLTQKAA